MSLEKIPNPYTQESKKRVYFEESPEKTLFELAQTKVVFFVCGLLFLCMTLSIIAMSFDDLTLNLSHNGVNYLFFEVLRVPFSILALGLVLLSLIASNHRSDQTKAQIIETRRAIVLDQYYKHMDEFIKHSEEEGTKKTAIFNFPRKLHGQIWPNYRNGSREIDLEIYEIITGNLKVILDSIHAVPESNEQKEHFTYNIYAALANIANMLDIEFTKTPLKYPNINFAISDESNRSCRDNKIVEVILAITDFVKVLNFVLQLDQLQEEKLVNTFNEFKWLYNITTTVGGYHKDVKLKQWYMEEEDRNSLISFVYPMI